jgi:hypothetical protein
MSVAVEFGAVNMCLSTLGASWALECTRAAAVYMHGVTNTVCLAIAVACLPEAYVVGNVQTSAAATCQRGGPSSAEQRQRQLQLGTVCDGSSDGVTAAVMAAVLAFAKVRRHRPHALPPVPQVVVASSA